MVCIGCPDRSIEMKTRSFIISLSLCCAVIGLSSCAGDRTRPIKDKPQYWQRISSSTSLLQQGPKVQQILDDDLSYCLTEIRELEKMGAISLVKDPLLKSPDLRDSPSNEQIYHGKDSYSEAGVSDALKAEEEKKRDPDGDNLRGIHLPYKTLSGCMKSKGWEPVNYVSYEPKTIVDEDEYAERAIDQKYGTKIFHRSNEYK